MTASVSTARTAATQLQSDFIKERRAGSTQSWEAFQLQEVTRILSAFYVAPLSISTVQPVLDLAVALNPTLTEAL